MSASPGPEPLPAEAEPAPGATARMGDEWRNVRPRGPVRRGLAVAGDFARRVYEKAGQDNIFFLAGAIAFNLVVAFVPLVLAVLGLAGTVLRAQGIDSAGVILSYVSEYLPVLGREEQTAETVVNFLQGLIQQSAGLISVGTIVLAWVATRLIGTLRTVLREIFDLQQDRGIIQGKLFDLKMVLAAGTLFTVSVGGSVALQVVARYGFQVLGLEYGFPQGTQVVLGQIVAFAILWVMFLLVYRYLPARRTTWRTSLIAASFTAVFFELLKRAFSWYVTTVANYGSTYGSFAFVVILILWIYYSSVIFVLGGEVAQVWMAGRIRRRQKERLS